MSWPRWHVQITWQDGAATRTVDRVVSEFHWAGALDAAVDVEGLDDGAEITAAHVCKIDDGSSSERTPDTQPAPDG